MKIIFRDVDDISAFQIEGALCIGRDMGHTFSTTDSVLEAYGDELHLIQGLIKGKIVSLKSFSNEEFLHIQNLFSKYKHSLSMADCSVIYCAIATNGVLLTNEKVLINAASHFNIKTLTTEIYFQEVKLIKTG